jgi:hypothetical protein
MAYRFTKIPQKRRATGRLRRLASAFCKLPYNRLLGQVDKFRLADDSEVSLIDLEFSSLRRSKNRPIDNYVPLRSGRELYLPVIQKFHSRMPSMPVYTRVEQKSVGV